MLVLCQKLHIRTYDRHNFIPVVTVGDMAGIQDPNENFESFTLERQS